MVGGLISLSRQVCSHTSSSSKARNAVEVHSDETLEFIGMRGDDYRSTDATFKLCGSELANASGSVPAGVLPSSGKCDYEWYECDNADGTNEETVQWYDCDTIQIGAMDTEKWSLAPGKSRGDARRHQLKIEKSRPSQIRPLEKSVSIPGLGKVYAQWKRFPATRPRRQRRRGRPTEQLEVRSSRMSVRFVPASSPTALEER